MLKLKNEASFPAPGEPALRPVPLPSIVDGPVQGRESAVPLSHYVWVLRRHAFKMLGFVAAAVLLTWLASSRMTPVYEATATVDVDRQTPTGIIGEEASRTAANDSEQFLSTQVKLIQSDSVLRPVAEKYTLRASGKDGEDPVRAVRAEKAPVSLQGLKVSRPPNTYLLAISYRSPDPELAARVANAVAQSYLAHTFDLRFRASSNLSSFMEKQLDELRGKMERSTAALASFERELNVINPEEKTSILSARLLQLNTEYTNAQAERVRQQAAAQSLASGTLEAALASPHGDALHKLVEHRDDAQERFAQIRTHYGSNHPEHRKAAAQMVEIERSIERTREEIGRRVRSAHTQALDRERMLSAAVAETKAEFDKVNARSFEYQQLKREAEADKKLYDELVRRIREAGINAGFQNSSIRMADAARPPLDPVFPNVRLHVVLALILSTLVAVALALAADLLDNTVRDADEVSRALHTPVVGTLPSVRNWRRRNAPAITPSLGGDDHSGFFESVRTLRNSILLADFDRNVRTLLVTSASPSEGKSTTAAHLAVAHAEQGKRTLLIDADLRRPSIHRKFGFTTQAGLSSVLLGQTPWRTVLHQPAGFSALDILPAGPPSRRASDLIGASITELIDETAAEYDLVVVDVPPLLGFAEPLQMATCVDGVLLVARAGSTERKALASAVATLKRLRANVVGLVLNDLKRDTSAGYHYYGSYAKYYRAEA